MSYLGDYQENYATLNCKFLTLTAADVPTTLAGTPVISVYKANDVAQSTAGITLTVDFDGITGANNVLIDLSSDAFYAVGSDYQIMVTTGTVNGVSWVGRIVGQFSIQNRSSSLNTTALAALEDQFDGTGVSGDAFPATQAQAGNIATGSAAISVVASSRVLTTGSEVNAVTDTFTKNNVHHEISDSAGVMEVYYEFDVDSNGVGSQVAMWGRLVGANDSIGVYAYNWAATSWDQIDAIIGSNGAVDGFLSFNLLNSHTGTGANAGLVRVRGYAASGLTSATLYIDQAYVSYAVVNPSEGYENAAVWFDSGASNTNTKVGVDGISTNPVSTEAAVNTLLSSTGLSRVEVAIDSTITFATSHTSEFWTGEHWVAALGGQDLSSSHFKGADVSGIGTGTTPIDFDRCRIDTATIHQFHMVGCGFDGTLTCGEAGNYIIHAGHSAIAGATTPIIDTGAALANVNLSMPHYSNGIEIRNLNATGTDRFSISGQGQVIYAASSSGTVYQRGDWTETNTGGVTIVRDLSAQNSVDTLVDTADMQPKVAATIAGTIQKNTSGAIPVLMTDTDGSPVPNVAVTGTRKLDNGSFAAMTGTISNTDADGVTHVAYSAADVNGTNCVMFKLSATGAQDALIALQLT